MIEVSSQDISRAFGKSWTEDKIMSGVTSFYLLRIEQYGEIKWIILDQRKRILKRIRSKIVLGKILGVEETDVEKGYEIWLNLTSK